ncbi:MAG: SIMPL domain-containing protein [Brevefilum sp.]
MFKKYSLLLISIVALGVLAACSPAAAPAAPESIRSMSVSGIGRVTIVPDMATINIGVRSEAESVSEALEANNAQANALSRVLQTMGVEEKDIQTSNFNIFPNERWNPMTGEVEGRYYVVENTVNVTVRELSSLGEVLNAAVEAGANTIYGISFNVEDRSVAIAEARDLAIADAKAKAQAIAESAGVELGEIISINVYETGMPYGYFDGKGAMVAAEMAVPIAAGTLAIVMECNLSYAIK